MGSRIEDETRQVRIDWEQSIKMGGCCIWMCEVSIIRRWKYHGI